MSFTREQFENMKFNPGVGRFVLPDGRLRPEFIENGLPQGIWNTNIGMAMLDGSSHIPQPGTHREPGTYAPMPHHQQPTKKGAKK